MANSKNKYNNGDAKHVQDDCVEGDTVSEGDTSDEEEFDDSRTKQLSSSRKNKQDLEVASGSADDLVTARRNRRKPFPIALAFATVILILVATGVGLYFWRKSTMLRTSSISADTEPTKSTSSPLIPVNPGSVGDAKLTEEDVQDSAQDSNTQDISNDNTLGILDELIGSTESIESSEELVGSKDKPESVENKEEKESRPTKWPELVGMSGIAAKEKLELLCGEELYDIYILHEHDPTTRDYRFNRIRIFTNDEGIVISVPHIG